MKKIWTRDQLKDFFSKGKFPTELHFSNLIDSMFNKLDDGISKTEEDGLKLSPVGDKEGVMSFFGHPLDTIASWLVSLKKDGNGNNLSFDRTTTDANGKQENQSLLFLGSNGRMGIGTSSPRALLDVAGTIGIQSKVGTYHIGEVDGDGKWQNVFPNALGGVQAFEVVARIDGAKGTGKYALTHAIAVSTYGNGNNSVRQTRAYNGWYWNRIEFRWTGTTHQYQLQVRTRNHYGMNAQNLPYKIRLHVSSLWDDTLFSL